MLKEENHFFGKLKRVLLNTFSAHDKDQPLFEVCIQVDDIRMFHVLFFSDRFSKNMVSFVRKT